MRFLSLCLFIALGLSFSHPANADGNKRAKIIQLIKVSGAANGLSEMVKLIVPGIIQDIKKRDPSVSQDHAKEIAQIMVDEFQASTGSFLNMMVPLYEKVLSEKEIDAAIAFYSTPEGRSMIQKMPQLLQGGAIIGQRWGNEVGQRIAEKAMEKARSLGYQI